MDATGTFAHFVYPSNNAESGAPLALIRGGILYRVVKDHLGSVRMVVNATTGAVAQRIDYDAYGRVLKETGAGFQPFGFAGGLYDPTTKLVRFGARDYDANTGRWTNKDPIGFAGQQGNVYLYVNGDPVNHKDPRGLADWFGGIEVDIVKFVGLEIGGGVVFDTDHPMESGIYIMVGPAVGANIGIATQVGVVSKDIEGWGVTIDVNADVVSPVVSLDDKGNVGVAVGLGGGVGASVAVSHTSTLDVKTVVDWVKGLIN